MDSLRRQYLEQMGIQIWVSRESGTDDFRGVESPRGKRRADFSIRGRGEQNIEAVKRSMQSWAEAGNNTATAATEPSATTGVSISAGVSTKSGITITKGASRTGIEVPRFHLVFTRYQGIVAIYEVKSDGPFHLERLNQFCNDIIYGLDRRAGRQRSCNLKWPFLNSEQIEQNEETARQMVRKRMADFGGGCERVLLFGQRPASLIFDREYEEFLYQWVQVGDQSTLILDDISSYLDQPLTKRNLWKGLRVSR